MAGTTQGRTPRARFGGSPAPSARGMAQKTQRPKMSGGPGNRRRLRRHHCGNHRVRDACGAWNRKCLLIKLIQGMNSHVFGRAPSRRNCPMWNRLIKTFASVMTTMVAGASTIGVSCARAISIEPDGAEDRPHVIRLHVHHGGELTQLAARNIVSTVSFEGKTQEATSKVIARGLERLVLRHR